MKNHIRELKRINKFIETNLNVLIKYHEENIDKADIIKTLKTQKKSITKTLKNYKDKLEQIEVKNEYILTKQWWYNLSDTWKKVMLANIGYVEFKEEVPEKYEELVVTDECVEELYLESIELTEENLSAILDKLSNIKSINIEKRFYDDLDDLKPIEYLINIRSITIEENHESINNNKCFDLQLLNTLPYLSKLYLYINDTNYIHQVADLKHLTELRITIDEDQIKLLSNHPKLKKLDLDINSPYPGYEGDPETNLSQFSDLAGLLKLKKLHLTIANADLSPLLYLRNLKELSILYQSGYSIKSLRHFKNLNSLKLYLKGADDLSPIKEITKLKSLDLSDNYDIDLKSLKSLTNLTTLKLEGSHLTKINFLKNLVNLSELKIGSNKISNIKPLSKLINLKILDLEDNKISDYTPLNNLINLCELNISYNDGNTSDIKELIETIGKNGGIVYSSPHQPVEY